MDFGETIYTDGAGMQFRIRKSDQMVFTFRPSTDELVFLCSGKDWPKVAKRLGLKVRKKPRAKRLAK